MRGRKTIASVEGAGEMERAVLTATMHHAWDLECQFNYAKTSPTRTRRSTGGAVWVIHGRQGSLVNPREVKRGLSETVMATEDGEVLARSAIKKEKRRYVISA